MALIMSCPKRYSQRNFEDIMGILNKDTPQAQSNTSRARAPSMAPHIRHYHRPHLEKRPIGPCLATVHHGDLREPDGWLPVETFIERYREADAGLVLLEHRAATISQR